MAYKRILTIQDISCVGQCSMTVALPILSACGHETCILPTAVLSTHTGGFGRPAVTHLDGSLDAMVRHWQENEITFDAVYTGYLGSIGAIQTAGEILRTMLAPDGIAIVDPAMADHGKRYSGLSGEYAEAMKSLCQQADILLPNITEAAMLAGLPYRENLDEGYVRELLLAQTAPNVVLTGVGYTPEETGAAVREGECLRRYAHPRLGGSCHGTGDIFAAAFTGALMQEKELFDAVKIAADFTCQCIQHTRTAPSHWYGVKFEPALPSLITMLFEQ